MTKLQHEKINTYRNQYIENVAKYDIYGSDAACKFAVFENTNPDDKNIVIVIETVTSMNEYRLVTNISNLLVEPDGNVLKLEDVYPVEEVLGYIEKLKRIE